MKRMFAKATEFQIIGYEGTNSIGAPMNWGAAAVLQGDRLYNTVTGFFTSYEPNWSEMKESLAVTELEVPIHQSTDIHWEGDFVLDLPRQFAERAPYRLGEKALFLHGVTATGVGPTRAYYVFKSHEFLTRWLLHLHMVPGFTMVPEHCI